MHQAGVRLDRHRSQCLELVSASEAETSDDVVTGYTNTASVISHHAP